MPQKPPEPASKLIPVSRRSRTATFLGMPAWLAYSLLTLLLWGAWGAVSKIISTRVDAYTNQILFTMGLLPLIPFVLHSPRVNSGRHRFSGAAWAFLTGILGGVGNIAFFHALTIGGQASIVVPATALFPVVTVILAVTVLRERISLLQWLGLGLALGAIYLLSA
jgi:transporter family protein